MYSWQVSLSFYAPGARPRRPRYARAHQTPAGPNKWTVDSSSHNDIVDVISFNTYMYNVMTLYYMYCVQYV